MKSRIWRVMIAFVVLTALGGTYIAVWSLTGTAIPCVFHFITGFYCPGCGSGRMVLSLLKLNFYQAFRYNPLVFVILPFLLFSLLRYLVLYLQGKNTQISNAENAIFKVIIVLLILFGIARNLPAFDFLAPTIVPVM